MDFNSDKVKFRDLYLDSYEYHWFNVSTMVLEAHQCGFQKPIDDIEQKFLSLDKDLKELLTPFKIKETIENFKRKYIPYVTIERIGDKDTWDKISQSLEAKLYMDSRINNASIIVCMVEVVYHDGIVCVSKPSLYLLKKCLSVQPRDTEIVIITEPGIHASESKRIVYETLEEENIELPKAVHHAAETDIHDIVLGRVNLLIEDICKIATTFGKSLPESSHTKKFVNESFEEHASKQNISTVAKNIELRDGDSYIGKTSDVPLYYYSEFKIRDIRKQLIEKCSKTVLDQFKDEIGNKINEHVVNKLQLSDEIPILNQEKDFTFDLLQLLAVLLGVFFNPILATIVAPFVLLVSGANFFATAVYRIFRPINVNDPSWRIECVSVVVTNFHEKKTEIISTTSSSLNETLTKMTRGLERLKLQNLDSFYYQHYSRCSEDWLYSKSTFEDHQRIQNACKLVLNDSKLKKHVMKIVTGKDLSAVIYVKEKTMSTIQMPRGSPEIKIKNIFQTSEENRRIVKYLVDKKPNMPPKMNGEINNIISATSDRFFTMHSNLSVIEPSTVKSSKEGKTIIVCPCIVFVCIGKGKRPIGEPLFPREIIGIKTDIREGYYIPFTCYSCSVGVENINTTGSFGFLACKSGQLSREGVITAAHIVVGNDVLRQKIPSQKQHVSTNRLVLLHPSSNDSNVPRAKRIYGVVSDIHYGEYPYGKLRPGVDAAFVEKIPKSQAMPCFHINPGNLSHPICDIDKYLNKEVEKCGRTTGRTTGDLIQNNCAINSNILGGPLKNQYKIVSNQENYQGFAQFGDSGSGVHLVNKGTYNPIGILGGGTADGLFCYVTPITYILKALNLELFSTEMEY